MAFKPWLDEEDQEIGAEAPQQSQVSPEVREYLMQKYQKASDSSEVEGAQNKAQWANIGGALVDGLGAYMSPDQTVVYKKGWGESGPADVKTFSSTKPNASGAINKIAGMGVANAEKSRASKIEGFNTENALGKQARDEGRQDHADAQKDTEFGWRQDEQGRKAEQLGQEDDPTSMNSQIARDLASKLMPQSAAKFEGMSATQLNGSLKGMQAMYAAEQEKLWKQMQMQDRNQSRQDTANDRANTAAEKTAEKKRLDEEKKAAKDALTTIPGYEHDEKIGVRPEDTTKLREASTQLTAFKSEMAAFKDMIAKNGSFEFGGASGNAMSSLSTSLQMRLKNLYELGALSGPDKAIMESQIRDPGSIGSLFTRDGSTQAGLDQTLNTIENSISAKLGGSGYKKQQAPGGFPRQVTNAKTGETATVSDQNELTEANQHGFQ